MKREYTITDQETKTAECGIEYKTGIYNDTGEPAYILNNGYSLNHMPTARDTGTNNLKSMSTFTPEEMKEFNAKGVAASIASRQKRKTMKETIDLLLSSRATAADIANLENIEGLNLEMLTKQDVIIQKALELAEQGSHKHLDFLRDTAGERPTQQLEIDADIMTDADRILIDKLQKRLEKRPE